MECHSSMAATNFQSIKFLVEFSTSNDSLSNENWTCINCENFSNQISLKFTCFENSSKLFIQSSLKSYYIGYIGIGFFQRYTNTHTPRPFQPIVLLCSFNLLVFNYSSGALFHVIVLLFDSEIGFFQLSLRCLSLDSLPHTKSISMGFR